MEILKCAQVIGKNVINSLKFWEFYAHLTDFANALGVRSDVRITNGFGGYRPPNVIYGQYWLDGESVEGKAHFVEKDKLTSGSTTLRINGIRPCIKISDIKSIPRNKDSKLTYSCGEYQVFYGYYPRKVVETMIQEELECLYNKNDLIETGNSYTIDLNDSNNTTDKFEPLKLKEYEYEGKRYVRLSIRSVYKGLSIMLSDNISRKAGSYVWFEVEPVKWIVDDDAKIMYTKEVISGGIQYDEERTTPVKCFEETNLYDFLNNYLEKDLTQDVDKIIEPQNLESRYNKNPYNLEFEDTDEINIIKGAINANIAIFLHGKPGCGKSARIKKIDPDYIELNFSHLDPELLDGLAGEKNGEAIHLKPPWLVELEEKCKVSPDEIHILFLDELTNASPMMQAKAYGIALEKKVAGKWKLPANARVVAAGNEIEDSIAANEIAEPLYDRFAHVNIETRLEDWLNWAISDDETYEKIEYKKEEKKRNKIHPAIYSYIAYRGDGVLNTPFNPQNPKPHGNPRRWEMASKMLYETNNPNVLNAVVGENLTKDFIAFCKLPTLTIEDILEDNYTEEDLEMDLGRKLATVAGLVAVDEDDFSKVREFVKKLGPEVCKKFEVQWAHGDFYRLALIKELRMMEMQSQKHTKNEAQHYSKRGIIAFKNVAKNYDGFLGKKLSKEEMMVG